MNTQLIKKDTEISQFVNQSCIDFQGKEQTKNIKMENEILRKEIYKLES